MQDIGFLQESVENNRQTLKIVLDMLNSSKLATLLRGSEGIMTEHNKNSQTRQDQEYDNMKEDIVRIKRAFADEKMLARKREDNLKFGVDKQNEYISKQLGNITSELHDIGNNFEFVKSSESKLDQLLRAQNVSNEQLSINDELAQRMTDFSANQENQTNLLTHISRLTGKTSTGTLKVLDALSEMEHRIDAIGRNPGKSKTVRLIKDNQLSFAQGRVDVFVDGQWGTVCDDYFDEADADVVCRLLGLVSGEVKSSAFFGQGSERIWLDDVKCDGTEWDILECAARPLGHNNCGHSEDVGVICSRH